VRHGPIPAAVSVVVALGLCGCERTMKDMYVQPRLGPDAASPLFADGKGSRPPPVGSVPMAMGDLAKTSSGRRGQQELAERDAANAASTMPPMTSALLQRGQARYDIYCAPCHSPVGDGDGMIARRGFPRPPSYHQARLRESPDRHFFDVITQGYGVMLPYADRVTPQDRWAIVAYIRALQASRDMPVAGLAPAWRAAMAGLARSAPAGAVPQRAAASAATPPGLGASNPEAS
jgi:mono/diheme cytochrome c family protein